LETSNDPISRMRVYQLATALIPDAYQDAKLLLTDPITAENAVNSVPPSVQLKDIPARATRAALERIAPEFSSMPWAQSANR
jgi:hypothetical protein